MMFYELTFLWKVWSYLQTSFVLQVINSAAKTFYMSAGQVEYKKRNTVINPLLIKHFFRGGWWGVIIFSRHLMEVVKI